MNMFSLSCSSVPVVFPDTQGCYFLTGIPVLPMWEDFDHYWKYLHNTHIMQLSKQWPCRSECSDFVQIEGNNVHVRMYALDCGMNQSR